jgi:predicted ATPase
VLFTVISASSFVPTHASPRTAFLRVDNWDDWGKYRTMFKLVVFDESGTQHDIGSVKIGEAGLKPSSRVESGQRAPELPGTFDALDARHFSLGQSEDYYASLNRLPPELRRQILTDLRDCAYNLDIFEINFDQDVMGESLLRDVYPQNVRGRLHRLAHGNAQLTEFRFAYTLPHTAAAKPARLEFDVIPDSQPPSNVHVIIGRNGVGKTRFMRNLAISLLDRDAPEVDHGRIEIIPSGLNEWEFAGIVLVSFSAFDAFDLPRSPQARTTAHQVGLRHHVEKKDAEAAGSDTRALSKDFSKSFERCRVGLKEERWRDAIRTLEVDDLFAEANVTSLLDITNDSRRVSEAEKIFERLSSGHAVILLTITRLVELVDEKTLVLLDEPEGHLHPPLLSAFIRCLSDLLIKRNGVAIVATHSPVVLQEVPQSAAWKLRRSGAVSIVERPAIETFGENLGLLTREVFGLDVTRSGFHQLLFHAVEQGLSYEDVLVRFNQHLGVEARAIVRALIAERQGE